ncbi:MAG TPA: hypothetical protein VIA06_19930 [Candidatus Dormibacteraeota bacterium]|nr:hypothetical protein [Candidatus Dormibacteraeota bacterium]
MNASRALPASPWARIAPPALGLLYVLAWAVGLSVGPASADVTASPAQVVHRYLAQSGGALASYLLTEGLAALALAGVVILLHRAARSRSVGKPMLVAGLAAAAVSLAQCCTGVLVVAWIAPAGHITISATLIDLINRVDGAKMLILAVMALTALPVARARVLPAPFTYLAVLLALSLVLSGIGYLLALAPLMEAAFISLPLLILWILAVGVVLAWRAGRD